MLYTVHHTFSRWEPTNPPTLVNHAELVAAGCNPEWLLKIGAIKQSGLEKADPSIPELIGEVEALQLCLEDERKLVEELRAQVNHLKSQIMAKEMEWRQRFQEFVRRKHTAEHDRESLAAATAIGENIAKVTVDTVGKVTADSIKEVQDRIIQDPVPAVPPQVPTILLPQPPIQAPPIPTAPVQPMQSVFRPGELPMAPPKFNNPQVVDPTTGKPPVKHR